MSCKEEQTGGVMMLGVQKRHARPVALSLKAIRVPMCCLLPAGCPALHCQCLSRKCTTGPCWSKILHSSAQHLLIVLLQLSSAGILLLVCIWSRHAHFNDKLFREHHSVSMKYWAMLSYLHLHLHPHLHSPSWHICRLLWHLQRGLFLHGQ